MISKKQETNMPFNFRPGVVQLSHYRST